MKKLILIILAIGLLSGIYVFVFVWNKDHPDFENLKADYELNAGELYDAFSLNSEEASKKYNGKMIQLSGSVDEIEIVDSLTIAVYVFNEGMFGNEGIRCTFLNSEGMVIDAKSLEGNEIKGFCSGFNDSDVILEKCSIVKP